jgi:hypothetical protein
MANAQNMKVISIVLMVVGIALIVWGFQMADSVGNQVTESLTGSSTDAVMFRYIAGAASLAVGAYMFFKK